MDVERITRNKALSEILDIIATSKFPWIAKRLSSNDTGLTGGHQVGVYLPRQFVAEAIPEINRVDRENPDALFEKCYFPNQDFCLRELRAIYYNSKRALSQLQKNGRDEFRLTRWGGSSSPIQQHENTGAIWLFSIIPSSSTLQALCWVAESRAEEDEIEAWIGCEVEPKFTYSSVLEAPSEEIKWKLPGEWFHEFPTGAEIFSKVVELCPRGSWAKSIDEMLLHRRKLEFDIFQHLEISHVLPRVKNGFTTVDEFVRLANSVTNRRKSRAGTSLELNLESIFRDEQLKFETQKITEGKKKPDFLFPGQQQYRDPTFPDLKLHMLAAKTCCKDRWRQATTEAKRISPKHLFTLQEGVSEHQLEEMKASMVKLVVPSSHVSKFPRAWQSEIMTLKSFVDFVRLSQSIK